MYFKSQDAQQKLEAEGISKATGREILPKKLCSKPGWGTKGFGAGTQVRGLQKDWIQGTSDKSHDVFGFIERSFRTWWEHLGLH